MRSRSLSRGRIGSMCATSARVIGFWLMEVSFGCVQVTEREIRREIFGMCVHRASEVCLGKLCVTFVTGKITKGRQCRSIAGIQLQNLCKGIPRAIFLAD